MSFDPNDPKNLTAAQKLLNIKVHINHAKRVLSELNHSPGTDTELSRLAHLMRVVLAEIEKEVDRTV